MTRALIVLIVMIVTFGGCTYQLREEEDQQVVLSDFVAQSALDYAFTVIDAPYSWGGNGPNEFDCSGLVIWAYRNAYPDLLLRNKAGDVAEDVTAEELWNFNASRIGVLDLRPGNLVFFADLSGEIAHVGLFCEFIGNDQVKFISASEYFGKVVVDVWPLTGVVREQSIIGFGRLRSVRR